MLNWIYSIRQEKVLFGYSQIIKLIAQLSQSVLRDAEIHETQL